MARIVLRDLTRDFGEFVATDRISLEISDGEFVVLLGPSGCGKTTLLRMIAGLLEPSGGSIEIDGVDVTRFPARKRDLAMVFQSYALYPHLTVEQNLAFPLKTSRTSKAEIRTRVEAAATAVEIAHLLHRKPKELSGGQRQRVAVARALVREPKAFLMDEPLSNLDAKLRTATRQELSALHRRLGATFVYVTHDQVEAMTMATKIVLLNAGRIEQYGTPTEIYDAPSSVFAASFLGSPAMNLLDCTITSAAGQLLATGEGFSAPLWPGASEEREIALGVRPEHLCVVSESAAQVPAAATVTFSAVVEIVENLGKEQLVHCLVGSQRLTAAVPREVSAPVGSRISLAADTDRLHIFDRASGRRLEWIPDAPSELSSLTAPARRS